MSFFLSFLEQRGLDRGGLNGSLKFIIWQIFKKLRKCDECHVNQSTL